MSPFWFVRGFGRDLSSVSSGPFVVSNSLYEYITDGDQKDPEHRCASHTEDYRGTHDASRSGARAARQHQRNTTNNKRQRRHQDRA